MAQYDFVGFGYAGFFLITLLVIRSFLASSGNYLTVCLSYVDIYTQIKLRSVCLFSRMIVLALRTLV